MASRSSFTHRSFWRRSHDRSLHLIVAALTLWLLTFFCYRGATSVAVYDPLGELAIRGNAVLALMPTEHPARLDLVDIVQRAQSLGASAATIPSAGQPPAVKVLTDKTPPAAPIPKPGAKVVPPEVELASCTLRVMEQLQDRVDQARDRINEVKRSLEEKPPVATVAQPTTQIPPAENHQVNDSTSGTEASGSETSGSEKPSPPLPTMEEAHQQLTEAASLLPVARRLRALALWLADVPKFERERNFWATFWAITAAAIPASISFWYVLRCRQLPLTFPADNHLPAAIVRQRECTRDFRQTILGSYFLHALMIILPMLGFAQAYNLGPPGGGGGIVGSPDKPQEQIKIIQVKQRKLMVNPFSAIRINQPKELEQDLAEETRQMATAQVAGGSGDGAGGGYGQGVKGGSIRFVVVNHGGHGWDEANAVAAPNFLREFGKRVAVPTDRQPIVVRVSDLTAQRDPTQQPPLLYLCGDQTGFNFSTEDLAFLKKYTCDIGGLMLIDDTGGALGHAQTLAARLFPGQPLLPIPQDDILFRGRQPMGEDDRALAKHDGDRILGVRYKGRWVMVFHPGDLVDGWRGAYGPRWQEIAYRFGINTWDYAATQFDHVRVAREKK